MNPTAVTSRAAAALVAAVAGFASYRHIYDVATGAGEHQGVAAVLPLAIDGLILVATLAMLDDKRQQRRPRLSARVALVFGILATLCANVASAEPTATARMVAAIPAISFLLAIEVLARSGKPASATAPPAEPPAPGTVHTPPVSSLTAVMDATAPSSGTPADRQPTVVPTVTVTPIETAPATVKTTIRRPVRKPSGRRQLTAAEKVAAAVSKLGADASLAALMKESGVSESSVLRHRPKPAAAVNGHHHGEN